MRSWNVFLGARLIDTVYFQNICDEEYVRTSLIEHDGYDPRIVVEPG